MFQIGDSVRVHSREFAVVGWTPTGAAILVDDEGQKLVRSI